MSKLLKFIALKIPAFIFRQAGRGLRKGSSRAGRLLAQKRWFKK